MYRKIIATSLAKILLLALLAMPANGRTSSPVTSNAPPGSIEGTIVDANGGVIKGARVLLRNQVGQTVAEAVTGGEGKFRFGVVPAGTYSVFAEAAGFEQAEEARVTLAAAAAEVREIRLKIAAVSNVIVVSADRRDSELDSIAATATVISSSELTSANNSQLVDAIRAVPGLTLLQSGRRGGIVSIFSRGGESDYNKILIDGVPANTAGGFFDFAFLTPENVARVEVVRGAESALFGSDAISSVLEVVSKHGVTGVPEVRITTEGGSFGSYRQAARIAGAFRAFDYSGSFANTGTSGIVRNDDFLSRTASGNFGVRLDARRSVRATFRLDDSHGGVPGPVDRLFADPTERVIHRGLAVGARYEDQTTSIWNQSARFIYSFDNRRSFDPVAEDLTRGDTPPLAPGVFGSDFAFLFQNHQRRRGAYYQSILLPGKNDVLTAGFDWEHEDATFDNADSFSSSRVTPSRNNFAFYMQNQWSYRQRIHLTGGFRVEDNRGDVPPDLGVVLRQLGSAFTAGRAGFGFKVNPKVSAVVIARKSLEGALIGSTRIRFNFGTGIKEPDLTQSFSPSVFFIGNPKLKPERSVSYEIGVEQTFAEERVHVQGSYFDNRFRDQIEFVTDPFFVDPVFFPFGFGPVKLPDGTLTNFINADRVSARGLELVARARPGRRFYLSGSYTFLHSKIEKAQDVFDFSRFAFVHNPEIGLSLLRRPAHSGTFAAGYTSNRFDVSLSSVFLGRRRDLDAFSGSRFDAQKRPLFADSFSKVDLAASVRLTRQISAIARVDNLLNRRYEEVLGFPSYKLHFTAGLRLSFGGEK